MIFFNKSSCSEEHRDAPEGVGAGPRFYNSNQCFGRAGSIGLAGSGAVCAAFMVIARKS